MYSPIWGDALIALVCAIAAQGIGFLWYTSLFGEVWLSYHNFDIEDTSEPMLHKYVVTFIMNFIIAWFMLYAMDEMLISGLGIGLVTGFLFGLFFSTLLNVPHAMFSMTPIRLYLIDQGHNITLMTVNGGIIGFYLSFF